MIPVPYEALEELRRLLSSGYGVAVQWHAKINAWVAITTDPELPVEATQAVGVSTNCRNALLLAEACTERRIAQYCRDSKVSA